MSKNTKFLLCISSILLISIILIVTLCSKPSDLVASVDGEKIYKSQIKRVLNQVTDNSINPTDVLEESINRLVVVHEGKRKGISVSNNEFQELITSYKNDFSTAYERGIQIYGEDEFFLGLKYNMIFYKTKKFYMDSRTEFFNNLVITRKTLENYLKSKGITTHLSDSEYQLVKQKYVDDAKEEDFILWIQTLRNNADIRYYAEGSFSHETNPEMGRAGSNALFAHRLCVHSAIGTNHGAAGFFGRAGGVLTGPSNRSVSGRGAA